MKIAVYEINAKEGEASLLDSVAVEKIETDCEIIINTRDKWVGFHCQGGSTNPDARDLIDSHIAHLSIKLCNEDEDAPYSDDDQQEPRSTEVVVFAESEEEKALIWGIRYALQEKDQIIFLIRPAVIKPTITLASYRSENKRSPKLS